MNLFLCRYLVHKKGRIMRPANPLGVIVSDGVTAADPCCQTSCRHKNQLDDCPALA
jgi:hypothetical protein